MTNVTEDASTPAVATTAGGSSATSLTSASFSPPANSVIVASCLVNYATFPGSPPAITVSDSAGGTWAASPAGQLNTSAAFAIVAQFTRPVSSAPGSVTVTMHRGADTGAAMLMLAVRVLDSASVAAPQGASNTSAPGAGTTVEVAVTPTVAGSYLAVAGIHSGSQANTNVAGTTTIQSTSDAVDIGVLAAGSFSPVSSLTSTTVGWTHTGSQSSAAAVLEILPGVTHAASASLTVTPSLSATGAHVTGRPASLTVTPVFSATSSHHLHLAAAAASLTVIPVLSATDTAVHGGAASLTVTPALSAARTGKHPRAASLTITPVLLAAAALNTSGEPGYPDGPLGAVLEFLVNGTWENVTPWAMPDGRQSGQLTGGQSDGAQQPNPGSLPVQLDNGDYRFSPRNASGPYYPHLRQNTPARFSFSSPYGRYLRLEGATGSYAWCPEASRLDIAGSLDVQLEARLSGWQQTLLAFRDNGAGSFAWELVLETDGTLVLFWFDSGNVLRQGQSTVAFAVSVRAFRATLDASTGTVTFYTAGSIAGPWTQAGSAVSGTSGAATTIRASSGTAPLTVGCRAGSAAQLYGHVTAFRLYNGISGSGGTLVADAAFSSQSPGATAWTDTPGNAWSLAGDAELTNRDYRLHGELASIAPTAAGMAARMQAVVAGRLRRLQQGKQPTVESPLRRAIRTQPGSLAPVVYIPMEDGGVSGGTSFGPVAGGNSLTATSGAATPAADTSFEASAALPLLNGAVLAVTVPSYTGATGFAVRFPWKLGSSHPAPVRLIEVSTTGTVTKLQLVVNADGTVNFKGFLSGGSAAWTEGAEIVFAQTGNPAWWSIEATASGGTVTYSLVTVAPGASSGNVDSHALSGSFGNVAGITVNGDAALTDTVFGHLSVQKAVTSIFTLGIALDAWRGELAANRFARVCGEQNIPCRILGRPAVTQAMGAQPRGNPWVILQDCVQAEQGIVYEPRDVLGLGLRTAESLGSQSAALTLSFAAAANLRGDLQPSDDDIGLCNDVSASTTDGAMFQAVLDDGSPRSVSEPADGGAGDYTGSPVFSLADASQLPAAAALYLAVHSADEPRYRNVACDLGIPGAPAADIARVRPGDLVVITDVPEAYQTADIQQLAMGWKEPFGPGRAVLLDCVPASPYS